MRGGEGGGVSEGWWWGEGDRGVVEGGCQRGGGGRGSSRWGLIRLLSSVWL